MTITPLSALFASPMLKVTNKTKGLDVLIPMRCLKTTLKFQSRPLYHMMENGNTKVDQRILLPISIILELIAPTLDVLSQANAVLLDRESLFTVQTRGLIIDDLRVNYEGIEQNANNISSTPLKYEFLQLLYQGQDTVVTAQAADSSVVNRGLAAINKASDTIAGITSKVSSAFSSVF